MLFGIGARRMPHGMQSDRVGQEPNHCSNQLSGFVRCDQQTSHIVLDNLWNAAHPGRNRRPATGRNLHQRDRQGFAFRWQHGNVAGRYEIGNVLP